ncbi:MAG: lipid-A-disaccharide synthase [Ignavibacteriota bacterium]|nr:lipid-A-disaccharide synthase [Ignavibacteriota bacterium]
MCDIFIIAGESSGDLHSSHLITKILSLNPSVNIQGIGGSRMKDAGAEILFDYSEVNHIGFVNIAKNYFHLKSKLNYTANHILKLSPKILILCDFPGFNLRIAEKIKSRFKGKIFYYITPQVWAWHHSRINKLKSLIDICFVIFPFEKQLFDKEGVKSYYVGNPVLKQVDDFLVTAVKRDNVTKEISIMPGSRREEVQRMLPKLIEISNILIDKYKYKVNLICSENIPQEFYNQIIGKSKLNMVLPDISSNLNTIYNSDFVITKFGTSNLECALLNIPFTAVYKASFLNYIIARLLIRIKYVSLVNIVMNKEVAKEYIQKELTTENVIFELQRSLRNDDYRHKMLNEFSELRKLLTSSDDNIAEIVLNEL